MNQNIIKKSIKCILIAMILVLVSVSFEIALFERKSFTNPEFLNTYSISDFEEVEDPIAGRDSYLESGESLEEVGETLNHEYENSVFYKLDLGSQYLNTVRIQFQSDSNLPYTIIADTYTIYGQNKTMYHGDTASYLIGEGVTDLDDGVRVLYIEVDESRGDDITSISLGNVRQFNYERFLFILAVVVAIYLLTIGGKYFLQRLDLTFFILSMLFGISILLNHGISNMAWDEQIHFDTIYQMSFVGDVGHSGASDAYSGLLYPSSHATLNTLREHELFEAWADSHAEITAYTPHDYSYVTVFGRVGYIFQVLAMMIGRELHLSFSKTIYLCNFVNLFIYSALISLAIRHCKKGKYIIFFMCLMPVPLLLATAFSYDAFVIGFMMLGYALYSEELVSTEKLNYKRVALSALCIALGTIPKAIYFPMALLLLLFPNEKFRSVKERRIYRTIVVLLALALASTFVLPTLLSGSGGTDLYSDDRRTGTDTYTQLMLILHQPFKYAGLLIKSLIDLVPTYIFGMKTWTNLVYSGMYSGTGTVLVPVMLTFITLTQGGLEDADELPEDSRQRKIWKWLVGLMVLVSIAFIWTAMYLAFNPVGIERIKGTQGRYLIPLLWPMAMLFYNKSIRAEISDVVYNRLVVGMTTLITVLTIYMVYWSGTWMNVIG